VAEVAVKYSNIDWGNPDGIRFKSNGSCWYIIELKSFADFDIG
jgi:hypothetical protein